MVLKTNQSDSYSASYFVASMDTSESESERESILLLDSSQTPEPMQTKPVRVEFRDWSRN